MQETLIVCMTINVFLFFNIYKNGNSIIMIMLPFLVLVNWELVNSLPTPHAHKTRRSGRSSTQPHRHY